jgi:hypothetical protein
MEQSAEELKRLHFASTTCPPVLDDAQVRITGKTESKAAILVLENVANVA